MKINPSNTSFCIAIALLCTALFSAGYIVRDVKAANEQVNAREYQLEVYNDSTQIFDGNRHVATLLYDSTQSLDKVINWDNQ